MKLTPIKKQSKRERKAFYTAQRGDWNGLSPVTRVVESRRAYDRNRMKQESRKAEGKE